MSQSIIEAVLKLYCGFVHAIPFGSGVVDVLFIQKNLTMTKSFNENRFMPLTRQIHGVFFKGFIPFLFDSEKVTSHKVSETHVSETRGVGDTRCLLEKERHEELLKAYANFKTEVLNQHESSDYFSIYTPVFGIDAHKLFDNLKREIDLI